MNRFTPFDATGRKKVFDLLAGLERETKPVFGLMSAQHMVEHLGWALTFSSGKNIQKLHLPPAMADRIKSVVTDAETPIAPFKSPVMPYHEPMPLLYPDLATAIRQLETELNDFDLFFQHHPDEKPVNPVMGNMDHREWMIFHTKHFEHHFRQFSLI